MLCQNINNHTIKTSNVNDIFLSRSGACQLVGFGISFPGNFALRNAGNYELYEQGKIKEDI